MTSFQGFAAKAAGEPFESFSWDPGSLAPDDVEVAISTCGLCYSDLAMWKNEWGASRFPLVPGHEVTGEIISVGSSVDSSRVGQRVGIGWQSRSCGTCHDCHHGDEEFCQTGRRDTIMHGRGGFANRIRVGSNFAVTLPDGLSNHAASPLMCGGITVYTGMIEAGIAPGMRVAIVGIGGLGHLALQFSRAMGCETTALSSSAAKEGEARSFGARRFIDTSNRDTMKSERRRFDLIINTVSAPLKLSHYLRLLRPRGKLVMLGLPGEPVALSVMDIAQTRSSIMGSMIGSPSRIAEMLEYAALFDIQPQIEIMPMTEINEAFAKLERGDARYRIVLENKDSFKI